MSRFPSPDIRRSPAAVDGRRSTCASPISPIERLPEGMLATLGSWTGGATGVFGRRAWGPASDFVRGLLVGVFSPLGPNESCRGLSGDEGSLWWL